MITGATTWLDRRCAASGFADLLRRRTCPTGARNLLGPTDVAFLIATMIEVCFPDMFSGIERQVARFG